jgi:ABC-type glycerol-3-phosphate transport system substrate-binding protein
MARFSTLTALLAAMFVIAACGGGGPQGSERDAPAEPQQTQAAPAPAENEAAESAEENARRSEESSGQSVTTIEGKEVKLGAQGDVTALFFMAGW